MSAARTPRRGRARTPTSTAAARTPRRGRVRTPTSATAGTTPRLPLEGLFLFTAADVARVAAGELTVTWRLWKRAHVKVGRAYPAAHGAVVIDDVRLVRARDVTDADARDVGLADARSLIDLARSHKRTRVSGDTLLHRVAFHYVPEPPPRRPPLSLPEIAKRLARLDAASRTGPWTLAALRLVEEHRGVVARVLAAEMELPRLEFKARIRKLKALGLTESLPVGYELSPLGQAYLDSLRA